MSVVLVQSKLLIQTKKKLPQNFGVSKTFYEELRICTMCFFPITYWFT